MTVLKTLFKIEFFDGDFVDGCILVISEIPALYFQFGSMVITITYLNSFGLMAPILIWIIHMIFSIYANEDRTILRSLISTLLPIETTKYGILCEILKTSFIFLNLAFCSMIINYDLPFKYGRWIIFNNQQANFIFVSFFLTGFLNLVSFILRNHDKWSECTINIVSLIIIYFLTCNVILYGSQSDDDVYFVSYLKANYHSVSIKAIGKF